MTLCRLNRIYYPVQTLGYGQRLGVWVQGCGRNCSGCMSPEMQPYEGVEIPVDNVLAKLPSCLSIDGLTISGGEPFDQPEAVYEIVRWFHRLYSDDVLIYTGYLYEELLQKHNEHIDWLLNNIAALVDGPYIPEQDNGLGLKGSQNQRLFVFRYQERYRDFCTAKRNIQCIDEGTRLFFIGLSDKKLKE